MPFIYYQFFAPTGLLGAALISRFPFSGNLEISKFIIVFWNFLPYPKPCLLRRQQIAPEGRDIGSKATKAVS